MVPLNETSESGVVEQVEVESSEILETEVVHDDIVQPTDEQVRRGAAPPTSAVSRTYCSLKMRHHLLCLCCLPA